MKIQHFKEEIKLDKFDSSCLNLDKLHLTKYLVD